MKKAITVESPVQRKVPYSYLDKQFQQPEALFEAIRSVIRTGQYTLGPELQAFEKSLAQLCGTQFAVGVASGTDALFLTIKACRIGPGDEVITPAFNNITDFCKRLRCPERRSDSGRGSSWPQTFR